MHTVRNRKASQPPIACVSKIPVHRSSRQEAALLSRSGTAKRAAPPAFPTDLILPPRRGAVITAASWPVITMAVADAPGDALVIAAPPAKIASAPVPRGKRAKRRARKAGKPQARHNQHSPKSIPALTLPPVPEPLVQQIAPAEPAPEPKVIVAPPGEILLDPVAPLPRARSLVPARRQGLVDVIAWVLRDSGRRLARWSARRHKAREEQAEIARAARERLALQSQLEALAALREFAKAG